MRIAVPKDEHDQVSGHFGRALRFDIYEATADPEPVVRLVEQRDNPHRHEAGHRHGPGEHHHHHAHHHHGEHHHHGHHHDHGWMGPVLGDCDVVLARGMGAPAVARLEGMGVQVVRVRAADDPVEVMATLVRGEA